MLQCNIETSEGRDRQRSFAMAAFLLSIAAVLVVSLALRIAVDELALRWAKGTLDIPGSLQGS
jgi:hypothetical protein